MAATRLTSYVLPLKSWSGPSRSWQVPPPTPLAPPKNTQPVQTLPAELSIGYSSQKAKQSLNVSTDRWLNVPWLVLRPQASTYCLPAGSVTVCPLLAGQAYGNAVGVGTLAELEDDVVVGTSITTIDEVDMLITIDDDGVCESIMAELESEVELDITEDVVLKPFIKDEEVVDMSIIMEDDIVELDGDAVDWLAGPGEDDVDISIIIELVEDELGDIAADDDEAEELGINVEDDVAEELDIEIEVVDTTAAGDDEDERVVAIPAEDVELVIAIDIDEEVELDIAMDTEEVELDIAMDVEEDKLVVVVVVVVVVGMALPA